MPEIFELFPAPGKGILGELDDNGVVAFAVVAGPDSPIRGTAMFDRMLDQFGDRARAIRGVWIKRDEQSSSINIDKVNELVAEGLSVAEAAMQAWTATRARRRGFSLLTVVSTDPPSFGPYRRVEVLILRKP